MSLKLDVKEVFVKSLLELSRKKNIEKITVQNILDHSGAARQTFYNHFTDKYDLINYVYHYNVKTIFREYYESMDLYDCIYQVYQLFVQNKQFYTQIFKMECQNNFKMYLFDNTKYFYINAIEKQHGKGKISPRLIYIIDYTCYGATGICMDWIMNGMNESPEEMASKIVDCIHPELKKYFIDTIKNEANGDGGI